VIAISQQRPIAYLLAIVAMTDFNESRLEAAPTSIQKQDAEYLGSSRNDHGIIALLHSAYGVRFLHLFRTVVQHD